MKHFLLFFSLMIFFIPAFSQIISFSMDQTEKEKSDIINLISAEKQKFNGLKNPPVCNANQWKQIYFELDNKDDRITTMLSFDQITRKAKSAMRDERIPIGIIFLNDHLQSGKTNDVQENDSGESLRILSENQALFAAAALKPKTRNGQEVVFYFGKEFFFTVPGFDKYSFSVDFADGNGWRDVEPDDEIIVSYLSTGTKIINLRLTDHLGKIFYSRFEIQVAGLQTPEPDAVWNVTAGLDYNGVAASGDVYVLYGNGNSGITNPIVISEGVDFEDENNWEALYELLNQQNLLEDLRTEGFDVLVLNFNDALTYLQSNAFLIKEVIEMVNDSIDYAQEIIVVGPSMGGLVTRYALAWMENNGFDHNCNLWISFDAPHQGANLPLGLQYELLFFKDLDAAIQELLDALNEPAPRQMLVYHYTDPPSSPAAPDGYFYDFRNELASIGDHPQNLRKVALTNGRGDAIGQPFNPGDQVIDYNYNSLLLNIKGNVWAVQNNTSGQIFEGLIQPLFGGADQLNVTVFSPKPYDNSPGGISPTFAEIAEMEAPFGNIIALHDNHSFIPTVSSLDLATNDLFYNLTTDPNLMDLTPFDTVFWADDNYDHRYISPELAAFVIQEILASRTKTHDIELVAGWNDLSSFLIPAPADIEVITENLGDDLVIMYHFGEVFWPGQGVNLIGNWEFSKGYLIKMNTPKTLTIEGSLPENNTIFINEGWNLIPVLSSLPIHIETLLGENLQNITIIKDGVGLSVYWPAAGVETLQFFQPGSSYFLYATQTFELSFQ
jgi:hypothetical protein